ncbi:hypothetical protein AVEN_75909-1 [Araneus ventricosus]|uniref:Uncharacterized protein n=1 Tax=Araneus ventricosus TaxID=182803 RepID=A0A4Y2FU34_ARAVE|nr:hypothetical protein AVEN_75909-1 [Araneus ventricosus]
MAMGQVYTQFMGQVYTVCKLAPSPFFVITGTSGTYITNSFPTPEDVRPFQKAGPRKRSKKKRQTSILIYTPVNNALQIEKEKSLKRKLASAHPTMSQSVSSTRTRYYNGKNSVDKKFKNKKYLVLKENLRTNKKTKKTFDSDEDENCLCIYCLNPYEDSRSGEQWVQCTECERGGLMAVLPMAIQNILFV